MRRVVQGRIARGWDPRGIDKPFQPSPVQGRGLHHHVEVACRWCSRCKRRRRRRRLKGIHSRPDTNRTGAEGLSFYYTRLLYCLNQMLAVMSLSQHRVSSSKTVRPPCGARCIGHAVRTWAAVCSEAPHSQFGKGARPHLCMDEWNRPTPVRSGWA